MTTHQESAVKETAIGAFVDEARWSGCLFDGDWRAANDRIDVLEKATGEVLTRAGRATPDDVRAAAKTAKAAQRAWAATSFEERADIMRAAAALVKRHGEELTGWIVRETGCIPPKAGVELKMAKGILEKAAAMLGEPQGYMLPSADGRMSLAKRVPHGVVGVISPFNFPLILSIRAVVPALATGNAVLVKPDPQTPFTGGILIARLLEEAGLPKGLLHVLPGGADAGGALCEAPETAMISFTGSTAAGRKVGETASRNLKRVQLELGGKNALIILDDADLDRAASNAAWGAYLHQGQICMASGRILVHESLAEGLIERLAEKARHLPVGDPAREHVALGPLINERQRDRVHSIVQDTVAAGARLVAGGTYEKLFYRPTVLAGVKPGMRAFEEEIFGPVACVTTFASDDEAVELANATEYGLSAGVISASVSRALAVGNRLDTGLLHINDQTVADEPYIPFGGRGQSGNGESIGGPANWDAFTQWRWITIKDEAPQHPF